MAKIGSLLGMSSDVASDLSENLPANISSPDPNIDPLELLRERIGNKSDVGNVGELVETVCEKFKPAEERMIDMLKKIMGKDDDPKPDKLPSFEDQVKVFLQIAILTQIHELELTDSAIDVVQLIVCVSAAAAQQQQQQ